MKIENSRGFTLIEVMVVITIIGLMGYLIIPKILDRPDQARVTITKADIGTISNILEIYKLDNFVYPSTDQGLEALVKKPSGFPEAKNWKTGGYLSKAPIDPWGNPYQYISPGLYSEFDLYSLGADGKEGGEGNNADIVNWGE